MILKLLPINRICMETVAVIDFETTGLSPAMGDRATEVAVVVVDDGKIVDRFQSLMNAGARIPGSPPSQTGTSRRIALSMEGK